MGSVLDLVILQRTLPQNLEYVMNSERDPENSPFVGQWTLEEHKVALGNPDLLHLIAINKRDNQLIGFAILTGLQNSNHRIELKRLVITDKGKGYGKETLRLIKSIAFRQLGAHRLWLDVRSNNPRAKHVYESEGFVVEGILRESVYLNGQYLSLSVMSILENEFKVMAEKD
jgi:diamine N-acetyltransferase